MNSHIPWNKPPDLVDDYRSLDTIMHYVDLNQTRENQGALYRYHECIEYSLSVMQRFSLEQLSDNKNCLIILIGDHQPPTLDYLLEGRMDKFATPIHIITKDTELVNTFIENGFNRGWVPVSKDKVQFEHQDLNALIISSLASIR